MIRLGSDAQSGGAAVLAELADLPYFRVDGDRNVVEMSPAMERLTGFEAVDIVGGSCLRVHRCEECLKSCGVFDNHTVTDKHLELYRADGSTVQVRKSGQVFLDEDGEITGAIEVVFPLEESEPALPPQAREEKETIQRALEEARYRRADAADRLGMSRTTLWRKMREYGL